MKNSVKTAASTLRVVIETAKRTLVARFYLMISNVQHATSPECTLRAVILSRLVTLGGADTGKPMCGVSERFRRGESQTIVFWSSLVMPTVSNSENKKSEPVVFLSRSGWTQLDTRQNVLANNTDCSDALGADNIDSVILLTLVDRNISDAGCAMGKQT